MIRTIRFPKPNGPDPLGLFFPSLQMLLDPFGRSRPILFLEGSVEDGFAFEARALGDALDGGVQMSPCTQQGDGMRHT